MIIETFRVSDFVAIGFKMQVTPLSFREVTSNRRLVDNLHRNGCAVHLSQAVVPTNTFKIKLKC